MHAHSQYTDILRGFVEYRLNAQGCTGTRQAGCLQQGSDAGITALLRSREGAETEKERRHFRVVEAAMGRLGGVKAEWVGVVELFEWLLTGSDPT